MSTSSVPMFDIENNISRIFVGQTQLKIHATQDSEIQCEKLTMMTQSSEPQGPSI